MKLEGIKPNNQVKHLVIDEMQDYSPVQYRVLSRLYPCKKTILGDINQSVNPFSSSNLESIEKIFPDAAAMTMLKSYRSTYEITNFTKRISQNFDVEPLERYGEEPKVIQCQDIDAEVNEIKKRITDFKNSENNSLGIICKTQKQADRFNEKLKDDFKIKLLNDGSADFGTGIVITTAYLAKGLEFDWVIVPQCTNKNYNSDTDKQMLYVATTRAMHRLYLTYTGKICNFLKILSVRS